MDRSGLVVMHRNFLKTPPRTRVHVTEIEPSVAADMVNTLKLRADSCVSYEDITNQLFWKVHAYIFYSQTREQNSTEQ